MHDKAARGWIDAATVPGDRTTGRVENVEEGHEYEFRIVAVNKAGPSEPSDPSKSVVAKPRFCKYPFYILNCSSDTFEKNSLIIKIFKIDQKTYILRL